MSIIDGFVKYNSYIADANGDHHKVSSWTHSDTVEMPDGSSLSDLTFEDNKVTQTEVPVADYQLANEHEILFANSTTATTLTEGAKKSQYFKFKPHDVAVLLHSGDNDAKLSPNVLNITTSDGWANFGDFGISTSSTNEFEVDTYGDGTDAPYLKLTDNRSINTFADITVTPTDITLTGTNNNPNTWDGTHTSLKDAIAAAGAGGGSTVTITPSLQSGTKVADYTIDGVSGALYAPPAPVEITGTLTAGSTTLTLQDVAITTTATYDFFTDAFGVSPTDIQVTTGEMVLTFEAQQSDVSVKVRVS